MNNQEIIDAAKKGIILLKKEPLTDNDIIEIESRLLEIEFIQESVKRTKEGLEAIDRGDYVLLTADELREKLGKWDNQGNQVG